MPNEDLSRHAGRGPLPGDPAASIPAERELAEHADRGTSYASTAERELAEYADRGTVHGTFYATDAERPLDELSRLVSAARPEFVAKTAVYCRERGRRGDVAAILVAWLAARDVDLMLRVFPRVIDDARTLRTFVGTVRSGVTGRRSFGSAPKRALREWFAARSPEVLFRQSVGSSPSMSDVIKMVRPPPRNDEGEADAVREALYGYLIGRSVDESKLPALTQAFEAWKRRAGGPTGDRDEPLPDVPFEMLTALPLRAEHWTDLTTKMTFGQLHRHLGTLYRHGVFADPVIVDVVAERLEDPRAVARSRALPYELLATYRAAPSNMPPRIVLALARAIEHAVANVPAIRGSVALCPDVSGSMHAPVSGHRGPTTSLVRCIDVAALATAALLRKSEHATVLPYSDDVVALERPLDARDSVLTNADVLSALPSRGTSSAAPLRWLSARGEAPDLVVVLSDDQAWTDFRERASPATSATTRGTVMAEEWERLRAQNPRAKLVLVDLKPRACAPRPRRADVLEIGGFSDAVFDAIASFSCADSSGVDLLEAIDAVAL